MPPYWRNSWWHRITSQSYIIPWSRSWSRKLPHRAFFFKLSLRGVHFRISQKGPNLLCLYAGWLSLRGRFRFRLHRGIYKCTCRPKCVRYAYGPTTRRCIILHLKFHIITPLVPCKSQSPINWPPRYVDSINLNHFSKIPKKDRIWEDLASSYHDICSGIVGR